MWKLNIVLASTLGCFLFVNNAFSQEIYVVSTNPPATKFEAFEAQTGKTFAKGISQIGTVATATAILSVRCKESVDIGTGQKEYGISIGMREENREEDSITIDYEELDSFLGAIESIINFDVNATSLSSILIFYTTKAQLRISGYSGNRNPGNVSISLTNQLTKNRILLTPVQLAELKIKLLEAKGRLDVLKKNAP